MKAYFADLAVQFTDPVTAIAQILGFIPIILGYFVFRNNNRKTIITVKAVSDMTSAIHFALLQQWTGCLINTVNIGRGVCFYQRGRYAWASGIWMPMIFCGATVCTSVIGWTGPESLLAMVGTCLGVIGYWCRSPGALRKFNFVGIFLWTIYGFIVISVPTVVGNMISMVSIALTEIRVIRKKMENNVED